jgi:hypothetical protein
MPFTDLMLCARVIIFRRGIRKFNFSIPSSLCASFAHRLKRSYFPMQKVEKIK